MITKLAEQIAAANAAGGKITNKGETTEELQTAGYTIAVGKLSDDAMGLRRILTGIEDRQIELRRLYGETDDVEEKKKLKGEFDELVARESTLKDLFHDEARRSISTEEEYSAVGFSTDGTLWAKPKSESNREYSAEVIEIPGGLLGGLLGRGLFGGGSMPSPFGGSLFGDDPFTGFVPRGMLGSLLSDPRFTEFLMRRSGGASDVLPDNENGRIIEDALTKARDGDDSDLDTAAHAWVSEDLSTELFEDHDCGDEKCPISRLGERVEEILKMQEETSGEPEAEPAESASE